MGLVSTWLNGIGLNSVAPTFEAAGIVTPSHLAELDVSYFESLGVTDPDDRRKLFYLVQRIKMAVNKKSPKKGDSVEERVDAVISESFIAPSSLDGPAGNHIEGITGTAESVQDTSRHEKKGETKGFDTFNTHPTDEPRRSRRLASKAQKENHPVLSDNQGLSDLPSTVVSSNSSSRGRNNSTRSATTPSSNPPTSPSKRPADSSNNASGYKASSPSKALLHPVAETEPMNLPQRISTSSKDIFNLQTGNSRQNDVEGDSQLTSVATTTESGVVVKELLPAGQTTTKYYSRRPESRLPGSLRTGKGLSVIPSETAAPLSPLGILTSSAMNEEIDKLGGRKEHSKPNKRTLSLVSKRRATVSPDSHALEELLQSSLSESSEQSRGRTVHDEDSDDDEGSSRRGMQRFNQNRSKSMTPSDFAQANLQQHHQLKRSSTSLSTRISRPSLSDRKPTSSAVGISDMSTAAQSRQSSTASTSHPRTSSAPIVQGMSESESWATKIGYLREDNRAEHELFGDQVDIDEHEYYDMRIKVIIRKRPLSKSEANLTGGGVDIIQPLDYGEYGRILVYQPKTRVDLTKEVETIPFAYDNVFDESSTNLQIYQRSLRNLIGPLFEGQWATCFAYGQTGSGKTYTMMGSNITGKNAGTATQDDANLGLYYLAALDIFEMMQRPDYNHLKVHISLFEIYGGKLFDLLNERKQVKCLEDSRGKVCFPGLTEHPVHNPEHVMELIEEGAGNRSTGTTSRNADSSRSHAVLQIKLTKPVGRKQNIEHARFNFIDLAGSERGADTSSSSRATRLEGAEINTSLLALKEVIRALATGGSMTHIPFRGSKLTQVLKDSFVGDNTRCCMVACISPDIGNCEQTLNTLRYADRVKERNPESGVLSSTCQQPIKVASLHQSRSSFRSERDSEEHDEWPEETDFHDEKSMVSPFYETDSSLPVLESAPPAPLRPMTSKRTKASSKQKAAQALVASHRAAMSTWLSMVKKEMILVNEVDADRDRLDEYLAELQELQSSQLGLISSLRESLHRYVSAAEGPQLATDESDDDSFEDLRD